MKLTKGQSRFINNKSMGVSFLKGKKNSGKTIASIYRTINLKNNYCLFEDDEILYLTLNNDRTDFIKNKYDDLKDENYFYSLFSYVTDKVNVKVLQKLIDDYSDKYLNLKNYNFEYIVESDSKKILDKKEFIETLTLYSKKSKLIRNLSIDELFDEISWIKSSRFTLEEYMTCNRTGRKKRIRKNSSSRELLFNLVKLYNEIMLQNSFMDKYDKINFAIEYSKLSNNKFTHIMIDESEKLSRGEIEFINSLYKMTNYSSITFMINTGETSNNDSWFVKGRKTTFLEEQVKNKTYILKGILKDETIKRNDYMERFKYINLKYRNEIDFNIDNISNNKEIYLEDNVVFKEDELKEVPVFNEIAAGNHIEINEEIEESFYLPSSWLERGKDTFILQVKGDSMIEKNICNGDLVVIKKQPIAYNNDIVAASLDGEATLKILNTNEKYPKLMPANSRYSEINLIDKEVSILGVAIGIIKYQN